VRECATGLGFEWLPDLCAAWQFKSIDADLTQQEGEEQARLAAVEEHLAELQAELQHEEAFAKAAVLKADLLSSQPVSSVEPWMQPIYKNAEQAAAAEARLTEEATAAEEEVAQAR
jgi:hypothetical protein